MQGVLLRGVSPFSAQPVSHFEGFLLRIIVAPCSDAISLSVALKRPERSLGGTTDSRTSSITKASARVYIKSAAPVVGGDNGGIERPAGSTGRNDRSAGGSTGE